MRIVWRAPALDPLLAGSAAAPPAITLWRSASGGRMMGRHGRPAVAVSQVQDTFLKTVATHIASASLTLHLRVTKAQAGRRAAGRTPERHPANTRSDV